MSEATDIPEARTSFGWVIETGDHQYWNGWKREPGNSFSRAPGDAIRFARRADAEAVIYHLLEEWSPFLVAREHGWLP